MVMIRVQNWDFVKKLQEYIPRKGTLIISTTSVNEKLFLTGNNFLAKKKIAFIVKNLNWKPIGVDFWRNMSLDYNTCKNFLLS